MKENLVSWLLTHYGQEIMKPGLLRMREALSDLLPHFSQTKIITIAGTNGKGETTLRLSTLLKEHRQFVWTSPHIKRLTERFRDQDGEIEEETLFNLVKSCHEKVVQKKWELSYYEFLFLVFCTWASKNPPEFLLLEVGLGGRLDAVNVFDADLVLLPSISRDHQEILGRRYDQILKEKLGVLRPHKKLIHYLSLQYLSERAQNYGYEIGAEVISLTGVGLPAYEFSKRNEALAVAAYSTLFNVQREFSLENSLEYRGEFLKGSHHWLFYGSHNVDGLRKLIQFLQSGTYTFPRPPYDSIIVAFSKRSPDDLRVMMRMLKKSDLGKIVVTIFDHPKAALRAEIEVLCREEGLDFVSDTEKYIKNQKANQRFLVTGSYYFLGHVKSMSCCR